MNGTMKLRVSGMHCPACVALVEREFAKVPGTKKVLVALGHGHAEGIAEIEWEGDAPPDGAAYDALVSGFGYRVNLGAPRTLAVESTAAAFRSWGISILVAVVFVALYFGFQSAGIPDVLGSMSGSGATAALLAGIAASLSSCLALVGSLVLALGTYSGESTSRSPIRRNGLFQLGRIGGFALLGGVLGQIGAGFAFNERMAGAATITGGLIALILGIGLLIPKSRFGKTGFRLPGGLSRALDSLVASRNPLAPIALGIATFFLPCGFALSMQALSVGSGSFAGGASIMGAFAVGTAPVLFMAGMAGTWTKRRGMTLSRSSGLVVVAFAVLSVSAGVSLFAAGVNSRDALPGATATARKAQDVTNDTLVDSRAGDNPVGVQRIELRVNANSFEPSVLRIKAGVPVEWVIIGVNPSGCTNRIIVPGTDLSIPVLKGDSQIVRFTANEKGTIPFSCWMGMVHGKFIVE